MTEEERRYIDAYLAKAEANKRFFSNACRAYRERLRCAMFLRALGVPFVIEELISVLDGSPDRIDVKFREARFQMCERFDPGRRRQAEANARVEQLTAAKTLDDALLGYPSDYVPMSHAEAYSRITEALAKKASSYGVAACAKLDALVHMQLHWRYLDSGSPLAGYEALLHQCWRSVSLVLRFSSRVVYAKESAPTFLREYVGQTKSWSGEEGFFDL
jgi:putative endonuclease (uncharacterized protein DUF1780)